MRKGFEGRSGTIRDTLGEDPLSVHVFMITNRSRSRVKALFWDDSGLWVCTKRVAVGSSEDRGTAGGTPRARIAKYDPPSETLSDLQLDLLEDEPGVTGEEVQAESHREPVAATAGARAGSGATAFAGEPASR